MCTNARLVVRPQGTAARADQVHRVTTLAKTATAVEATAAGDENQTEPWAQADEVNSGVVEQRSEQQQAAAEG